MLVEEKGNTGYFTTKSLEYFSGQGQNSLNDKRVFYCPFPFSEFAFLLGKCYLEFNLIAAIAKKCKATTILAVFCCSKRSEMLCLHDIFHVFHIHRTLLPVTRYPIMP